MNREDIDVKLLEFNGSFTFPVRGASGGLALSWIVYLVSQVGDTFYSYPIQITTKDLNNIDDRIHQTVYERLSEFSDNFKSRILDRSARRVSIQGGDLGNGSNGIFIEV